MATYSSVLAWRIPETGERDGLPSMGSDRVGHDWSDLAAAARRVTSFPFSNICFHVTHHLLATSVPHVLRFLYMAPVHNWCQFMYQSIAKLLLKGLQNTVALGLEKWIFLSHSTVLLKKIFFKFLLEEGMATHSRILAGRLPMGRGTWWATVHGVKKSRTRLSD